MNPNTKMIVGAIIAAALAIAVYYGAISQQSATNIQGQANQALGVGPASQQRGPATSQIQTTPTPASPNLTPTNQAPRN